MSRQRLELTPEEALLAQRAIREHRKGDGVLGRFRKRPVIVEAMRWPLIRSSENNISERAQPFHDWMGNRFTDFWNRGQLVGRIKTLEGEMEVAPGDWVIKGVRGEFYPCKPDIFAETYESLPAPEDRPQ